MLKQLSIAMIFIFILIPDLANARICTSDERDRAEHFSEVASKKIISKYDGGKNERIHINSCEYNTYSKKFKVNADIYWDGNWDSSNKYHVNGEFLFGYDGEDTSFKLLHENEQAKEWSDFKFLAGAVIEIGKLTSSNSNDKIYDICIDNECIVDLSVLIHYKNLNGEWVTEGWENIKSGESYRLLSNKKRVQTRNLEIYYFAATPNRSIETKGSYKKEYDGRFFLMKKAHTSDGTITLTHSDFQ